MPLAKSGRARLCGPSRSRRCGAGSRRAPSGSRTGPTSRPRDRRLPAIQRLALGPKRGRRLRPRRDRGGGPAPSPEASRAQLMRRAQLRPHRPAAHAGGGPRLRDGHAAGRLRAQVDRLLASPHFGERMALYWLDLVRYADSGGYHSDNARADVALPRLGDRAFNAQQAVRPVHRRATRRRPAARTPSDEQKIASGYNRLLKTTEEGGAQAKEYRAKYLADRVRNASSVWLGATLGCAQCHDHKFDPYLAARLLRLRAFFADMKELPVGRRKPDVPAGRGPEAGARRAGRGRSSKERKQRARSAAAPRREWETALAARRVTKFTTLEPVLAASANGTRVMIQGNDFSIIASTANGPKPPTDTYRVRFKTELERLTAMRLEALTFEELPRGGPGRDPTGGFVVSEIEVRTRPAGRSRCGTRRPPRPTVTASSAAAAIDGNTKRRRLGARARPMARATGWWSRSRSRSARAARPRRSPLVVHQNAGRPRTLGRFRLAATTDAAARPHDARTRARRGDPDRGGRPRPAAAHARTSRRSLANFYRARRPSCARARRTARRRARAGRAWSRACPQSLRHDGAGARARCASCRAATGWTSRARS